MTTFFGLIVTIGHDVVTIFGDIAIALSHTEGGSDDNDGADDISPGPAEDQRPRPCDELMVSERKGVREVGSGDDK